MVAGTQASPVVVSLRPRASVQVGLLIALAACPAPSFAQTGPPPDSHLVSREDVARRLGATFRVDPETIVVGSKLLDYTRLKALHASIPKHNPPLYIRVEAESGDVIEVIYRWPGSGLGGLVGVPQGDPRPLPVVDQTAAQRLAVAAVESCLDGLPDTYELVEATYNDARAYLQYVFRWQEVVDGVRLPHRIRVSVDAFKGRVASLSRLVYPVTVPLEPRVTAEEAIRTALDHCRPSVRPGETLATPDAILEVDFAHSRKYPYPHDRQFLMWSMKLSTAGPTPRWLRWVGVDALTGEIVGELLPGGEEGRPAAAPAVAPQTNAASPPRGAERADLRLWSGGVVAALVVVAGLLLRARRRARAGASHCP